MRTETGVTIRLEDYKPSDFAIPETHLRFVLHSDKTRIYATLKITPVTDNRKMVLVGDGLKLISLGLNGVRLADDAYHATTDELEIYAVPSEPFTLEIETEITPSGNTALMGLYRTNNVYCTQCEAEGFRRMTYYLDRPDVLSVYHVRIEAKAKTNPLLLSNGNIIKAGSMDDGWHFAEWHDPHPKPSYLFALVAGDLEAVTDHFKTKSGREVVLNIYVEHGKGAMADYAMDALKRSMAWDEEVFGLEYDLDLFNIVAVSDFNMGAMENKGLNIFNDKYVLADHETATDQDYANIETIIAHEYFHNWTGNRITCRDWFQLCLKEGLTVYRDHEFSADQRSRAVKRIQEIRTLKAQQFPEDQGPLSHPVRPREYKEINNFYTATIYEKGSEVVRMLHTLLGPEIFKKSLDFYFQRHDGDAATIEQFLICFEEVSGRDLSQFSLWYEQSGTPELEISERYNAAAQNHHITIKQSQKATAQQKIKKPLHIPVSFALLAPNGKELAYENVSGAMVQNNVIELTEANQEIIFTGVKERPVASLLRGFSAPVVIKRSLSLADQIFLAKFDDDDVNRWQALVTIYNDALVVATANARQDLTTSLSPDIIDLVAIILADAKIDPAFKALCLVLPSESDIAREVGTNIDPEAIHKARAAVQKSLCQQLLAQIEECKTQCTPPSVFSPDAESAGLRALHNRLLEMEAIGKDDGSALIAALNSADNMTDRMAMLTALAINFPLAETTEQAFQAFRKRYDGNALVLDKWFSLVAAIPGETALNRVQQTMLDRAFDNSNPNRVRSLIGSFTGANPTGFHRVDGKAYQFFASFLLEIDQRNPQLSARMLTGLRAWASLEPKRKSKMRSALSTIAKGKNISRDLREIVERMIG